MGSEAASDFVAQCGGFAEKSRIRVMKKDRSQTLPPPIENISAQTPQFGALLIPIADSSISSRYSEAVYPQKRKILTALGVEPSDIDIIEVPSEDTKALCNRALQYLLERTEGSWVTQFPDFEGMVHEKLNSKFATIKSLLGKHK